MNPCLPFCRTKVAIGQFAGAADESEMGEINAEVRARLANFRKKLDRLRQLARKQVGFKIRILIFHNLRGYFF